jgi:hypothetical protein
MKMGLGHAGTLSDPSGKTAGRKLSPHEIGGHHRSHRPHRGPRPHHRGPSIWDRPRPHGPGGGLRAEVKQIKEMLRDMMG